MSVVHLGAIASAKNYFINDISQKLWLGAIPPLIIYIVQRRIDWPCHQHKRF